MKYWFIGLVTGLILCAIAYYMLAPAIKKTAYDNGFVAGTTEGIATGKTEGITAGIAACKADIQRRQDSVSVAKQQASRKSASRKARKPAGPIQNWHVINGKIAEPIPD